MSKPIVKIQTLEDSPSRLDRRLVLAYLQTTYRLLLPALDLRIGRLNAAVDEWLNGQKAASLAFLTAWNPGSRLHAPAENRRRNRLLEKHVRALSFRLQPGCAVGDDPEWTPEPGFFVPDLPGEVAVEAGRLFEQNAIVFAVRGAAPELWWIA